MKTIDDVQRRPHVRNRRATGRIQFGDQAWSMLQAYEQRLPTHLEAGGVLLGRRLIMSDDVVVDEVTIPMDGDERGRSRFHRARRRHQEAIQYAWDRSQGTVGYLGEWHSHPENRPTPSLVDRYNWTERLLFDRVTEPLFFVIVGIEVTEVWESYRWCKAPRFERLL